MIKLYYNISTTAFIGKVADPVGEVWAQGDVGSKELHIYFGTGTTGSFTNGLTSTTIYDYNCRVYATLPDYDSDHTEYKAALSASRVVDGTDIYYKITNNEWLCSQEGTVLLDTQRYTESVTIAYGQTSQDVGAGTPGAESTYALSTELAALESTVNDIDAAKYEKSGLVGTTAEIAAGIATDQPVYTSDKVDELIAANSVTDKAYTDAVDVANSVTDQAYTDAEITKVTDGTYTADKATKDAAGNVITTTYATKTELAAEVEDIEDGTTIALKASQDDEGNDIVDTYATKAELAAAEAGLYDVKGTVATYADLLLVSDPASGDVYNVTTDENTGQTGMNYVWNGSAWDTLGGVVPLATTSNSGLLSSTDYDKLQNVPSNTNTNIAARVEKLLSNDTSYPVLTGAGAGGTERLYVDAGGTPKKITLNEIVAYAAILAGGVTSSGDFAADGLGAYKSALSIVHQVSGSSGQYKVNVKDIDDMMYALVLMPDTSADAAASTQLSFDDGTTYRYLKINGANVPVANLSGKLLHIYRDGTTLVLENLDGIEHTITHDETVESTYGVVAPLAGGTPEINSVKGLTLYQSALSGDDFASDWTHGTGITVSGGNLVFTAVADTVNSYQATLPAVGTTVTIVYRISAYTGGGLKVYAGSGGGGTTRTAVGIYAENLTVTTDTTLSINAVGETTATVDWIMVITRASTPISAYTASQVANLLGDYWEGYKHITDWQGKFVGKNLFDKTSTDYVLSNVTVTQIENGIKVKTTSDGTYRRVDYNIYLKPNTDYNLYSDYTLISGAYSINILNGNDSSLIRGDIGSFTTPSNGYIKIRFYITLASSSNGEIYFTNIQLEEGTTATTYQEYRDETFTLYGTARSVGTVRDEWKKIDNVWKLESKIFKYTLLASDISAIENYNGTQIIYTAANFLVGLSGGYLKSEGNVITDGYPRCDYADIAVGFENYFYLSSTFRYGIIKTLGTYANLSAAQTALAGTVIYYVLATPTIAEAEFDGTTYQDSVTTIIQQNNNATAVEITYALNESAQVPIILQRLATLFDKNDENEADIEDLQGAWTYTELDTAIDVSNSATVTAANITLSSGVSNFDFLLIEGVSNFTRFSYLLPTGFSTSEPQTIGFWFSSTAQNQFTLELLSDTTMSAYKGVQLAYTFGSPANIVSSALSSIDITAIYGVKK